MFALELPVAHDVFVPSVVRNFPLLLVWFGSSALMAALAVDCPVPPFEIASVADVAGTTLDPST
jgi:hypothetical protein